MPTTSAASHKRARGEGIDAFLTFDDPMQSDFISTCVNYRANVNFYSLHSFSRNGFNLHENKFHSTVLLVGTKEELTKAVEPGLITTLPFGSSAEVKNAITRVDTGKAIGVTVKIPKDNVHTIGNSDASTTEAFIRVLIGCIPSESSRHNCPLRPDIITTFVSTAFAESPKDDKAVDIIALSTAEDCESTITAAVARGTPRSFQTKGKLYTSEGRCLDQKKNANIFFTTAAAEKAINPDNKSFGHYTNLYMHHSTPTVSNLEKQLTALATATQLCQRLVDAPTNILDTASFTAIAKGVFEKAAASNNKSSKIEMNTIIGEDLRLKGYGGVYGVGKGAEKEPALVTLLYTPTASKEAIKKRIALVGKGVVYDCGGLALKAAQFMTNMKTDMGGAAAVFCSFLYAAVYTSHPSIQLSCTLCLVENAIGPKSFRNDDILFLKSGKTVEVNNTDAEGRLILADGVFHATSELAAFFTPNGTPDLLVDMATLTGAQGIATGRKHAAIYVNNDNDEAELMRHGKKSGDTVFPVVYCPEYHVTEFATSKVADLKNLMTVPNNAGVSCGGFFVGTNVSESFTNNKGGHVHVDLAFPTSDANGATGYGVPLLASYFNSI